MKKTFFAFCYLLLFLATSSHQHKVLAQGQAGCLWTGTYCTTAFIPACEDGYKPPDNWVELCAQNLTEPECTPAQYECIPEVPLGDCVYVSGSCYTGLACPSGFTHPPNWAELCAQFDGDETGCNSADIPCDPIDFTCDPGAGCAHCSYWPDTGDCITGLIGCFSGYIPPSDWNNLCAQYNHDMTTCSNAKFSCVLGPCGGAYERCCGSIPPLYCNAPYIPSDYYDLFACYCMDPNDLIPPPPGSNCIGFTPPVCPPYAPFVCTGSNFVWCCPDVIECEDAKSMIPSPTPTPVCGGIGVPTGIGCINVMSPTGLTESILNLAVGFAGGISFLLILFGIIQIMVSSGDSRRIQAGKELIIAAIAGLILVIFAVFVLRLVGAGVLQLPEFG